jgi:hypothetical protein
MSARCGAGAMASPRPFVLAELAETSANDDPPFMSPFLEMETALKMRQLYQNYRSLGLFNRSG